MKTTEVYEVQGMTCSGCERSVQKMATSVAGVESAKADHVKASLTLEYDPAKAKIEDIREAVARLGYKVLNKKQ